MPIIGFGAVDSIRLPVRASGSVAQCARSTVAVKLPAECLPAEVPGQLAEIALYRCALSRCGEAAPDPLGAAEDGPQLGRIMGGRLAKYGHVPHGLEMVIDNPDIPMGKVWDLWWNVTLSDDPEVWDDEIVHINEGQRGLGELTTDQRLIRAHIAEFCRLYPLFPRSIELLCEEIGTGILIRPMKVGCEGRDLLDSLGCRSSHGLSEQRKETLAGYRHSLNNWLAHDRAQCLVDAKVFGYLGQPTVTKEATVQQFVSAIDPDVVSISSLKPLSEKICMEAQGESVFDGAGRPLNCFQCEGCSEGEGGPGCGCAHGMLLDAALLCAGSPGRAISVFDEFARFTQESILVYALALNAWLLGQPTESVASLIVTRYVTADLASRLAARVHASLGGPNEAKEWLTACLFKTITGNQRWHKRVELIDSFPSATSWFRQH